MSELDDSPRRVSFQDALSLANSNVSDTSSTIQEPTVVIHDRFNRSNDDSEQALNMVTDESVSEESGIDDALTDDSACLIHPLPFHLPTTLEGASKESEQERTGIETLYPFGNLFPIEDLQQDLLACGTHKRSLETKDDLSHRRLKRFKSSHDAQGHLDIDGILALEQDLLARKASESLKKSEQFVPKTFKPEKTTVPDTLKSIEFTKMYNQCLSFRETHGHCAIPLSFPENPDLAYWAKNIRMAYSRVARGIVVSTSLLSEEQILELNKIGFCWNLKEHNWNFTFESLRDQIHKHGVAGDCHTRWLKAQRKRLDKNKLTPDQARKILSLKSGPFLGLSTTPVQSAFV
mmetsp:Transcript_22759/g.56225  ORF Transcript_22759/g.56225 Transcript_22759/m.56225 type:complete len:348 (+) Transcript_22759:1115-2158(+)